MTYGLFDVGVRLGDRWALDGVTIEAEPGRLTVVIGADGAGKTTVARTLVGLIASQRGEVRSPGVHGLGYQPESAGTWPDLTVAENMSFVAGAHRSMGSGADRIESLLEVNGLSVARDRLASALSGGMRQKLAVSMAMIHRPELLVLDEPTTGLDPVSRAELWRLLARAAAEGAAVVVTSTYLDEAERAARVVVLDDGAVLASGTASSIRSGFLGALTVDDHRPADTHRAWRRGGTWHRWWPSGEVPVGARTIPPDLEDVVTAAAVGRREAS